MSDLDDFERLAERAARAGGAVLRDWMGRFSVREKGPADLVTEADVASQDAVRGILLGEHPGHGFLAEENVDIPAGADGCRWIVDPLDGTTNYVHGIPQFAVSIALERHGEIIVGVIYEPVTDHCYSAKRGHGATINGQPIRSSATERLADAVVSMSLPARVRREAPELQHFLGIVTQAQSIRRIGSAAIALANVASGKFDAYWSTCTKSWDIAAGVLLIREAGGVVTALDGGPVVVDSGRFITAGTPQLHAELLAALVQSGLRG